MLSTDLVQARIKKHSPDDFLQLKVVSQMAGKVHRCIKDIGILYIASQFICTMQLNVDMVQKQ